MNNTRAALPSTHAVSPASTCTAGISHERPRAYSIDLQGVRPPLTRPYPDQVVDRRRPHLAVADLPGCSRLHDDVHDVRGVVIGDHDVEAHLGHEVHLVLRAAIYLGVALLPAVAVDLGHGQTVDPECLQRRLHVVELERLDDGGDEPHAPTSVVRRMDAPSSTEPRPPVETPPEPQSYADSPCSLTSMPSTSASDVTRQPIVYLIARAMIVVTTPHHTMVNSTPRNWCQSSVALPP